MTNTGPWYRKDLGDALTAALDLDGIRAAVGKARSTAGSADGVTVLVRHESNHGLHCHVVVYFPPGAGELAAGCGALACRAPSGEGLSPLEPAEAGVTDPVRPT